MSAWAAEQRLVLGQCQVDAKSNETIAIPVLIDQLDVEGAVVSIDAVGTQAKIARQLRDRGADYTLALKGNQGKLHQQAVAWFQDDAAREGSKHQCQFESREAGHHRIERHQLWQIPARAVFAAEQCADWASLVVVRSERRFWNKTTVETRYFLSSLAVSAPESALEIRGHWGIENSLHCRSVESR